MYCGSKPLLSIISYLLYLPGVFRILSHEKQNGASSAPVHLTSFVVWMLLLSVNFTATTLPFMFDDVACPPISEAKGTPQDSRIFSSQIAAIDFSVPFSFFPGLPFCGSITVDDSKNNQHGLPSGW